MTPSGVPANSEDERACKLGMFESLFSSEASVLQLGDHSVSEKDISVRSERKVNVITTVGTSQFNNL